MKQTTFICYVCANIAPFSLREQHKLQAFGKEVLREMFGSKQGEVYEQFRILHWSKKRGNPWLIKTT
jgi:hypothetical protein